MSEFIDRLLDPKKQQEEGQEGQPVRQRRRSLGNGLGWLIIALIVGIYLSTGIYTIGTSEEGLVKRFGRYTRSVGPGLHYRLPSPFESVVRVNILQVRKEEVGFRTIVPPPDARYQTVETEALMLTGDGNISSVQIVVQYLVSDAEQFAFNLIDHTAIVKEAAEATLREVVATKTLDETLTEQRAAIGTETLESLQDLLDKYETGIRISNVQLQDVAPPREVLSAFDDVNSARQDKEKLINQADRYALDIVPKARGEAQEIANQADAYKQERTKRAEGEVARFLDILARYELGQEVTRTRLLIETMEEIFPSMDKIILSDDATGLLKLLDLGDTFPGGE